MKLHSTIRQRRTPEYKRRYATIWRTVRVDDQREAEAEKVERSIDAPAALEAIGDGSAATVGEVSLVWLDRALGLLTERERSVVVRHYGIGCEPMTDSQMGRADGVTSSRILQIRQKALRKMRRPGLQADVEVAALMAEGPWLAWKSSEDGWLEEEKRRRDEAMERCRKMSERQRWMWWP